jgi:hypothetical protein
MTETSVVFVGDNGWTDMAADLPAERMTSAHDFYKAWWKGVRIYHRNGYRYEVESAEPESPLPPLSKLPAAAFHTSQFKIQYEYHSTGFYQFDELKQALHDAVEKDDSVLTRFHAADELRGMVAKATTFDDLVEMLNYAATEKLSI